MTKILVVDDEPQVRGLMKHMIEDKGYEVVEAENGTVANTLCAEGDIDLIVTDLVMPEKNGIDLILLAKQAYPNLPIVAISGGGGITGRYDYLEIAELVGAKRVIRKPFTQENLMSAISDVLCDA